MKPMDLHQVLDCAFHPKSVAIVGVSKDSDKLGTRHLRMMMEYGYQGRIYPVHPKEDEIMGLTCYKSVKDIPEPVDRVLITVPTPLVPEVIKDSIANGAKVVQICSAGFGEMGDEGKRLEEQIVAMARSGGIRLIGPNCIGTYCPKGKLNFSHNASREEGNIAVVSQSGGLAGDFILRGNMVGLTYSKVISIGNSIDLDACDFLEYLIQDEDTSIIAFYIESVRNGSRFMRLLKEATKVKPVIILKGGRTEEGHHSVASHTGNLAGNYAVWQALFKQTGAVEVLSLEEMLMTLVAFRYLGDCEPGGVALVGNGGGATVLAVDQIAEVGLPLSVLSDESINRLKSLDIPGGIGRGNPMDLPSLRLAARNGQLFGDILEVYQGDRDVSYIIFHFNLLSYMNHDNPLGRLQQMMDQIDRLDLSRKGVAAVLRSHGEEETENIRRKLAAYVAKKQVPVFSTIEQALMSIGKINRFQLKRKGHVVKMGGAVHVD